MDRLIFPVKADFFAPLYENAMGCPLNDADRGILKDFTELLNGAYQDGIDGVETALYPRDPAYVVDEFIKPGKVETQRVDPNLEKIFLRAVVSRCTIAWNQGRKDAKGGAA